jgi:hypothetical protein
MKGVKTLGRLMKRIQLLLPVMLFPLALSAQLPDIPDLIRVTVDHEDNRVLIQWEASTDKDIAFYTLYSLNEQQSFDTIVTLPADTFECKHDPGGLGNLSYSVTAMDNAGSESILLQNVHRAVSLSTEFDLCARTNTLRWTGYEGWDGQISGYNIYGGLKGDTLHYIRSYLPNKNEHIESDVMINSSYCYYVEAINSSTIKSYSAIDTIASLSPEAPSYLAIDHVNVVNRVSVDLQFTADIAGPVTSFRLMRRGNADAPFTEVSTLWNVSQPSHMIRDQVPAGINSYQYMVESVFQPAGCDKTLVISQSNTANSILLTNLLQGQTVYLEWTPYVHYLSGLESYVIQRKSGSGEFVDIESVGPSTTSWSEELETVINGFQPGEVQYKVLAIENENGLGDSGISASNISSIAVETHMKFPSAFTPGSGDINQEFKPLMDFGPEKYLLVVVDRGGRKMFETTNPGEGWDGRYQGGDYVQEGVYVYYVQYTDYTGLFKTITGNITVLYP